MKLKLNSIYFFRYNNPSTKISMWDRAPIVIPIDINSKSLLALNLHWLPVVIRKKFVLAVLQLAEKMTKSGKTKLMPRLYYDMIKSGKFSYVKRAIRRYHISRMTSIVEVIPEDWTTLRIGSGKYKKRIAKRI